MLPTAAGVIGTTRDHRILRSRDPRLCAVQLLDSVPADDSWLLRASGDELLIVQRMAGAARAVRLDPFSGNATLTSLEDARTEHIRSAVLMGETLVALCGGELLAFDPDSGELLHERELPRGARHLGAGVFWIERTCRRLSCARGRFEEERLPARDDELRTPPLVTFQRSQGRGLWAVSRESPAILPLADDEPALRYRGACAGHTLRGVSHDGNRVVLGVRSREPVQRREVLLDLESRTVRTCGTSRRGSHRDDPAGRASANIPLADLMRFFEPRVMAQVDVAHGVRTRFSGVFIDEEGALGLISHRRVPLLIRVVQTEENTQLALVRREVDLRRARAIAQFDLDLRPPAGAGYRLRIGMFSCGSSAILDSRGLLHLRSAVQGIPEISLVLGDRWLAGWSSEGRVTGPRHFLVSDEQHVEPALFDVGLRHFAAAVE
jgi:hypothetical protein